MTTPPAHNPPTAATALRPTIAGSTSTSGLGYGHVSTGPLGYFRHGQGGVAVLAGPLARVVAVDVRVRPVALADSMNFVGPYTSICERLRDRFAAHFGLGALSMNVTMRVPPACASGAHEDAAFAEALLNALSDATGHTLDAPTRTTWAADALGRDLDGAATGTLCITAGRALVASWDGWEPVVCVIAHPSEATPGAHPGVDAAVLDVVPVLDGPVSLEALLAAGSGAVPSPAVLAGLVSSGLGGHLLAGAVDGPVLILTPGPGGLRTAQAALEAWADHLPPGWAASISRIAAPAPRSAVLTPLSAMHRG